MRSGEIQIEEFFTAKFAKPKGWQLNGYFDVEVSKRILRTQNWSLLGAPGVLAIQILPIRPSS
jgi:hypothetical protein